jgi:hypothetical protein
MTQTNVIKYFLVGFSSPFGNGKIIGETSLFSPNVKPKGGVTVSQNGDQYKKIGNLEEIKFAIALVFA